MKITVNITGEVQVEAGLKICQIRKHPVPVLYDKEREMTQISKMISLYKERIKNRQFEIGVNSCLMFGNPHLLMADESLCVASPCTSQ